MRKAVADVVQELAENAASEQVADSRQAAQRTWLGFERATTAPGVRNHVLILSMSGLENGAARAVHRMFPNTVLVSTLYGRGHVGEDLAFQRQIMATLATHPNVGACLVLGPDDRLVNGVTAALDRAVRPWVGLSLQGVHEDRFRLIEQSARAVTRLTHLASRQQRVPQPLSTLSIAIECGHSDATSGVVANPLVGHLACRVVRDGGRAVFSETVEWTGTDDILAARAVSDAVADEIRRVIARRHALAAEAGHDVQANNPGPQNHDGGLTTLEEKSLGAIAKGGQQPIVGVLQEGQAFGEKPGLYLMDTPTFSPESITSMIAAGAQISVFTTGQGNPYGSALTPTIKVCANPDATAQLGEQIDFDASAVVAGTALTQELVPALHDEFLAIAGGALTWSEAAGEGAESISRLGPSI